MASLRVKSSVKLQENVCIRVLGKLGVRCKKGDCAIFETFTVYKIEMFILKNMAVQLTAGFFGIVHRKVFTGPLHDKALKVHSHGAITSATTSTYLNAGNGFYGNK